MFILKDTAVVQDTILQEQHFVVFCSQAGIDYTNEFCGGEPLFDRTQPSLFLHACLLRFYSHHFLDPLPLVGAI